MTRRGTLRDTYAAALQHELVELEGNERLVGVVRRPLPWLLGQVDENLSDLGPPPDLLDAIKARREKLQERGMPEAEAHNRAMSELDYRKRYVAYLDSSEEAQEAIEYIEELRESGTDVLLVCYENTAEKRCHRTILREVIESN